MYQIRFRLGLRPRARWGSLHRSLRSPNWILGVLLLKERKGRKRERKRKGKEKRKEGKREKEVEGKKARKDRPVETEG